MGHAHLMQADPAVKSPELEIVQPPGNSIGEQEKEQQTISNINVIRPTNKRYFILFMFIVLSTLKSFQWICMSSITNVVAKYYNVDNIAINWTAIIFMVTFLVLALPVSWIMEQIGLRNSILVGTIGTTLGVVIKCFSCYPQGFYLNMFGHLLIGFSEPFYFSIYTQLASVWFPDNQVALATSIGILGDQLGIALGFIIPTIMVGNDIKDNATIGQGLFRLCSGVATLSTLNTIAIFVFFDDQPKHPPGVGRFKQIQEELSRKQMASQKESFVKRLVTQLKQMREYLMDKNFGLLLIGFGISIGTSYAIHTILNQMIVVGTGSVSISQEVDPPSPVPLEQWEDANLVVGNAGLILIVSGFFGSIACGYLLDIFHKFKMTTILTYLFSLLAMATLTGCLRLTNNQLALYLAVIPVGFFITGYACCGFEYGVEITYPRPELISSTLLNISAQIFGIPISLASSAIVDAYGSQAVGAFFCLILLLGLIVTCVQKGELKRQKAVQSSTAQVQTLD